MEIKTILNGRAVVIRPPEFTPTPLFCPLCDFPMKTIEDGIAHKQSGACSPCVDKWAFRKEFDLKKGLFPDKASDEWREYIVYRKQISRTSLKFR